MAEKRRGLGKGLGALIPTGPETATQSDRNRPVDVFFPSDSAGADGATEAGATATVSAAPVPALPSGTDAKSSTAPAPGEAAQSSSPKAAGVTPSGAKRAAKGQSAGAPGAAPAGSDDIEAPIPAVTPEGLLPVPGARFAEIPVASIVPNARQPRTVFDEDALAELTASITEIGVLQPIVVRPSGDGYELIMGERRWRATTAAGFETVPAIIRETEDSDLLRDALLENLHRSQLNPLEEAAAYQQLLDDFECTHEELAARVARSRPQISNTLRLLKLPPLVQRRLAAGVLSAGHARALLGLPDGGAMERLAQRIVAEGLSVRATEEIVALGGDAEPASKKAAPKQGQRIEAIEDLAARLSDQFDTRVKVSLGKSKGRLTVEFASVADLNRLLGLIAPTDPGVLR